VGFEKCSPHEATPDDAPTQTIFINRIQAHGILGRIETTNEPGIVKRFWNVIVK
jgi:hypothetical protein